jgi:hypothetical protein
MTASPNGEPVAQSVEHRPFKARALGSSPSRLTKYQALTFFCHFQRTFIGSKECKLPSFLPLFAPVPARPVCFSQPPLTFPLNIRALAWKFTCAEMGPTGEGHDTETALAGRRWLHGRLSMERQALPLTALTALTRGASAPQFAGIDQPRLVSRVRAQLRDPSLRLGGGAPLWRRDSRQ